MYRLPAESTATPRDVQLGAGGRAVVAAETCVPFPATVVITPFETLRMRLLQVVRDVEVAGGVHGDADRKVQLGAGGRAVVAAETSRPVSRHGGDHAVRDLADAAVCIVGDVQVAGESTATPWGRTTERWWPGRCRPSKAPPPATVVITPFETLRMRLFCPSAMYRCRRSPRRRLEGTSNCALVAGPLSPLKPGVPFPATTVRIPVLAANRKTTLRLMSAKKIFPEESTATPLN